MHFKKTNHMQKYQERVFNCVLMSSKGMQSRKERKTKKFKFKTSEYFPYLTVSTHL